MYNFLRNRKLALHIKAVRLIKVTSKINVEQDSPRNTIEMLICSKKCP